MDYLFFSAARMYGAGTLALVMTGMGADGLNGARAVHESGGVVLAQDEATSAVWGMPGRVSEAGIASATLPLWGIAGALKQASQCGTAGAVGSRAACAGSQRFHGGRWPMACSDSDYEYLRGVVMAQSANRIDPSRNALFDTRLTPIARLSGAANLKDFVNMLKADRPAHLHRAVAEAMTINETSFFRDIAPFEMLREVIFPRLIERRSEKRQLRIWSAASSTGQEAYSLAMSIAEYFPDIAHWDVKIIGTDISRHVVDYAQRGRYRGSR